MPVLGDRLGSREPLTLDAFDRLLCRPPWMRDALCREPAYRGINWFPERGQDTAPAKAVCARCAVRADCLAWALEQPDMLAGIWAGTTMRERRMIRRAAA